MSKTSIPDFIIVYGKEIPVVFKDNLKCDGEDVDGDTDGNIIHISTNAKKKEHLGILLHEMWHCYTRRSGAYYREDHDINLEEQMAEGFATIMQENFILRSRH
jgi:hypothetical protein